MTSAVSDEDGIDKGGDKTTRVMIVRKVYWQDSIAEAFAHEHEHERATNVQ